MKFGLGATDEGLINDLTAFFTVRDHGFKAFINMRIEQGLPLLWLIIGRCRHDHHESKLSDGEKGACIRLAIRESDLGEHLRHFSTLWCPTGPAILRHIGFPLRIGIKTAFVLISWVVTTRSWQL